MSDNRHASTEEVADLDNNVGLVVAYAQSICDAEHPADIIETLFSAFLSQVQRMRDLGDGGNEAGLHVLREVRTLVVALIAEPDPTKAGELLDAVRESLEMAKH